MNAFPSRMYVAATSQHVGKTTCTLGLIHALQAAGAQVGYCKPLGQQYITVQGERVDKDAILFSTFCNFQLEPDLHSPVILGDSSVTDFLDNPAAFHLDKRVRKAAKVLELRHEIVVYEGTGHPGVGSCVGLSNADVAHLLHAGVIMVVEGGIGNTIDRLMLSLALFERRHVPVLGVIVNKTIKSKLEKVRHYVTKFLDSKGIPLLGIVPYEEELGLPLMETIANQINGRVQCNEHRLDNRVRDIVGGSVIDRETLRVFDNLLLVVSARRFGDALAKIQELTRMQEDPGKCPLSGIILTGEHEIGPEQLAYIDRHQIPVVRSHMDAYETVVKISRIEVKINTKTPWKVAKAVQLFAEHVNLTPLLRP